MEGDGAPVDLATIGEGDALYLRYVARNHVRGNEVGEYLANPLSGQPGIDWGLRAGHRGQHVGAGRHGKQGGHRGAHTRHPLHRGLDLAEFDAVATDFDAVIGAAGELQRAVRPVASQVAGAVPGAAIMFDKALCGQFAAAAITAGDSPPGHPQLADHPVGAVRAVGAGVSGVTDDPACVVRERHAVWDCGPVCRQVSRVMDFENGCVHRGFGGTA